MGRLRMVMGYYSLRLTSANPVLNVSYIGFTSQVINVGDRSVINVCPGSRGQLPG